MKSRFYNPDEVYRLTTQKSSRYRMCFIGWQQKLAAPHYQLNQLTPQVTSLGFYFPSNYPKNVA